MNVFVAIGMDQDAVLCAVCTPQRFLHEVVVMPSCYVRSGLVTDRAEAALCFPEGQQPTPSAQGLFHLHAEAFFKRDFPCRVVGVTIPLHLYVPGYWYGGGQAEEVAGRLSVLVFGRPEEAPVRVSDSSKRALLHPSLAFCRVSPPCPAPPGLKNGRLAMGKGFLGRRVSVTVCPPPYCGMECGDQPVCRGRFLLLDALSDVRQERLHVLLCRACQEGPMVWTDMWSEKVKTVLNVREGGFLFREFQSSFAQTIGDEGLDLLFQDFLRDPCNEAVVTVAHQIDLLVHALQGLEAGVRVLLAQYPFQSVQRHISKDGTDDTALRRTLFRRREDGFVPVSCFQPCIEDGFLHRKRAQQPRMAACVHAGFDIPFPYPLRSGAV
jgi:hypothetical protein